MKLIMRNFWVLLMAFLVLSSSLSYGVSKHFCAGKVASVSYFSFAEACQYGNAISKSNLDRSQQLQEKSCCEDNYKFVKGNDFLEDTISLVNILKFKSVFFERYDEFFESKVLKHKIFFLKYFAKVPPKDRTVLFQKYLI